MCTGVYLIYLFSAVLYCIYSTLHGMYYKDGNNDLHIKYDVNPYRTYGNTKYTSGTWSDFKAGWMAGVYNFDDDAKKAREDFVGEWKGK